LLHALELLYPSFRFSKTYYDHILRLLHQSVLFSVMSSNTGTCLSVRVS
jgi:hypothetical protein